MNPRSLELEGRKGLVLEPHDVDVRWTGFQDFEGKRKDCTIDIRLEDGKLHRIKYHDRYGRFMLPVPELDLAFMDMAIDCRGEYVDVQADVDEQVYTWRAHGQGHVHTFLHETAHLNNYNRQLWGLGSFRDVRSMKVLLDGNDKKNKTIPLDLVYHYGIDSCAKTYESIPFPFTPLKTLWLTPDGDLVVCKCFKHSLNDAVNCHCGAYIIQAICTNPDCTHPPVDCSNNVIEPSKEWLRVFRKRMRDSKEGCGLKGVVKDMVRADVPRDELNVPPNTIPPFVFPTFTGRDASMPAGVGLLAPFYPYQGSLDEPVDLGIVDDGDDEEEEEEHDEEEEEDDEEEEEEEADPFQDPVVHEDSVVISRERLNELEAEVAQLRAKLSPSRPEDPAEAATRSQAAGSHQVSRETILAQRSRNSVISSGAGAITGRQTRPAPTQRWDIPNDNNQSSMLADIKRMSARVPSTRSAKGLDEWRESIEPGEIPMDQEVDVNLYNRTTGEPRRKGGLEV